MLMIVPIVVSPNSLSAKTVDLRKLSLDSWIMDLIQKPILLDTAHIVRRFLCLKPWLNMNPIPIGYTTIFTFSNMYFIFKKYKKLVKINNDWW